MKRNHVMRLSFVLIGAFLFTACAGQPATPGQTTSQVTSQAEQPVAPEQNPPGDIPDTQVFITYTSPTGGYSLEVPEGWARTEQAPNVRFVDKLDGVSVSITDAKTAPTAESARQNELAALVQAGHAVTLEQVQEVRLPAGQVVRADLTANSDKDAVTGKQVRLEENTYLFYKDGKEAVLTMWAPLGADNVDQWQRMAGSFRWQ